MRRAISGESRVEPAARHQPIDDGPCPRDVRPGRAGAAHMAARWVLLMLRDQGEDPGRAEADP